MLNKPICPRCLGYIPSNAFAGEYPGAISRVDNKTEVCSDCGVEEAILALVSLDHWPIVMYDDKVCQEANNRWLTRLKMKEFFNNEI
jgi:hypothetical protein